MREVEITKKNYDQFYIKNNLKSLTNKTNKNIIVTENKNKNFLYMQN